MRLYPYQLVRTALCQRTVLGRWAKRARDTWLFVWVKVPVRAHPSYAFRFSGGIICLGHVNCTPAPGLIYGTLLSYRNQANKDGGKMSLMRDINGWGYTITSVLMCNTVISEHINQKLYHQMIVIFNGLRNIRNMIFDYLEITSISR